MSYTVLEGPKHIGKTKTIQGIARYEANKGNIVCDVRRLPKLTGLPPKISQLIQTADTFITQEPTHLDTGTFIRNEILPKNAKQYTPRSIAHAFALDRENHIKKVVEPLLREGKNVIQKRNYLSSLVYQTRNGITIDELLDLPGNKIQNNFSTNTFILTQSDQSTTYRIRYNVNREINNFYKKQVCEYLDTVQTEYAVIQGKTLDETVQRTIAVYKEQV